MTKGPQRLIRGGRKALVHLGPFRVVLRPSVVDAIRDGSIDQRWYESVADAIWFRNRDQIVLMVKAYVDYEAKR